MDIDDIIKQVRSYDAGADTDLIRLAYDFAKEAHRTYTRKSGQPYITHPLATAEKLAELKMDDTTIVAGLLHDVHEDTAIPLKEIEKQFGKEVARLVEGVTKLGKLKYRGVERYVESLRKMFIAMADDIRVIIIKFADRIHNLSTLSYLSRDKQLRIARETLEIYAPIANRLGMGEIRDQLEDFAFRYVDPKSYAQVAKIMNSRIKMFGDYLDKIRQKLGKELAKANVKVLDINSRQKHIYSLYKKLNRPDIKGDITKIYDVIALRVIVSSVEQCYAALGIIHQLWKPLKGRIKDYIAQPKTNGYRSIHTTVFSDKGQIIEIQIRDQAMHDEAEYGIAAHWHYAETGKSKNDVKPITKKLRWVQELAKWKKKYKNDPQYLESLKIDVLQNQILIFTPKGDVIELPEGSIPVDFAYIVHTDLGNKCTGAKINNKIRPLETTLRNGDVVEIITDKKRKGPNPDWLPFVKTQVARNRIRKARQV
ncbi:MAG: RelA/SpoT family protein [Patescibacteria group bacterium]